MKKILKIGDAIYAQSIQNTSKSYFNGFPQREQFLFQHIKNLKIDFFKHSIINSIETIIDTRNKLIKYLKQNQYDGILIDNPLSILIIPAAINIPIVFDAIDWYDEMYLKEYGINNIYYLLRYSMLVCLDRADKVVCQSPVLLQSMQAWGLKTTHVQVIPNGYDQKIFYPYSNEKIIKTIKYIENKHKISLKGKNIIVYTGKVSKWYENLKLIAQAITPDQVFFIVGDGPLMNDLPEKHNVIKCGPVPLTEVPNYTNIADVLVFPVDVDCSPIAISEYLAVGKPIVMGKGRIDWLITNGKNGMLVDNSHYSWQKGISQAIKNKNMIKLNNLKLAKKLSWNVLSKNFEKFIIN